MCGGWGGGDQGSCDQGDHSMGDATGSHMGSVKSRVGNDLLRAGHL